MLGGRGPGCANSSHKAMCFFHKPCALLDLRRPLKCHPARGRVEVGGASRVLISSKVRLTPTARLRLWRGTFRPAGLAHLYGTFGITFLRGCYHQILGPRRNSAKLADGL